MKSRFLDIDNAVKHYVANEIDIDLMFLKKQQIN
jgi:hypothetical protein